MQLPPDFGETDPDYNEQVYHLQERIGGLIEITRNLCYDLRSPALDLGLIPSIRSIVSRFEMQGEADVVMSIDGDRAVKVDEDVAVCLFRCAGEALTNIQKHAFADNVQIELKIEPSLVTLMIADDGRGFVVPDRLGSLMEQSHFGLVSMRERLELLGGSFKIDSKPQRGTRLLVCIPL
jgi:two-component system sensor histidine kinase DegS